MPRLMHRGIGLVALVLLAACGGTVANPATPQARLTGGAVAVATLSSAPPTPEPAPEPGLLTRRESPPAGVSEQVALAGAGAVGDCLHGDAQGAEATGWLTGSPTLAPPDEVTLCLFNLAPNQRVDVQLALPDGTIAPAALRTDERGNTMWEWSLLPGAPPGEYQVTAHQGGFQLTKGFTVNPATQPQVAVLPKGGALGTLFSLALAGYQPGESRTFYLYRKEPEYLAYQTTIDVQANENGEAIVPLPTQRDDPPGRYILGSEPGATSYGTEFVVGPTLQTTTAPALDAASILQRHDTPPAGIAAFTPFFNESCSPTDAPAILFRPEVGAARGGNTLVSGESALLCFSGFAPGGTLSYQVTSGGQTWSDEQAVDQDGIARVRWVSKPGQPAGSYAVTATQDARSARGSFSLEAATQPTTWMTAFTYPAGTAIDVYMAGFQPGAAIPLRLYYGGNKYASFDYLSQTSVTADTRGEATYRLQSTPDDATGNYMLATGEQIPDLIGNGGPDDVPFTRFMLAARPIAITPARAPAGTPRVVALAGFEPEQTAKLTIFRQEPGGIYIPITTFQPPIGTDGMIQRDDDLLYTNSTDPPGEYVITAGEPADGASFILEPPEPQP